jgi:hypothetical protein
VARQGEDTMTRPRHLFDSLAWRGEARQGLARHGVARHGVARQGKARQGEEHKTMKGEKV